MAEPAEDQNNPGADYKRPRKPYKVAFTGECNVGKSSLFRRMFKKDFTKDKPPSGVDKCTHHEIFDKDETVIPLEIWDTADMEKHGSITQSYYRGSHFVLLVYSAVDEYSLHRLSVTADDVKKYEPAARLILVRNKIDLPIENDGIPAEKEKEFLRSKKKICANFWTSAKENEGVENLLRELGKHSLKMFKSRRKSAEDDQGNDGFRLDIGDNRQENQGSMGCCA